MYTNWTQWSQTVQQQLQAQKTKMEQLENQVLELEKLVDQIRQERPGQTIERIEYKFDQLKIETLEGTLNIGLSPTDLGDPDTFTLSGDQMFQPIEKTPIGQEIQANLQQYLNTRGPEMIEEAAKNKGRSLDHQLVNTIMEDIYKQLPKQTKNYITQYPELNDPMQKQKTIQKMMKDFDQELKTSLHRFFNEKNS
ncbi:spore germination protein GerPC [Bacillaceae bacterium S4-13-58]